MSRHIAGRNILEYSKATPMSKVAVCIATYNDATYLPILLGSLYAQTYRDFHIYVSYDGCHDNTERVLEDFQKLLPITVADYEDVPGIGRNKNKVVARALKDSRHQYIQMLDADDFLDPRFLFAIVQRMDIGDIDWAICWGRLFGDRSGYIHSVIEPLEDLFVHNKRHSWGTFRADTLRKHNYDPTLTYAEDWDLWIRLDLDGFVGDVIRHEFYYKRWHDSSLMAQRGNDGYFEARALFNQKYATLKNRNGVL